MFVIQNDLRTSKGDLMAEFEDALVKQRANCMSGFGLAESRDNRLQTHIQHRLSELEGYYFFVKSVFYFSSYHSVNM